MIIGSSLVLLRFSGFIKFVSRSLFGELRHRQIPLNLKLLVATKKSEVWEQDCVRFFNYFVFGRNYHVLKSNSPCILLNKNINFDKNETESKMENLIRSFREMNLLLQLKQVSQIKSKAVTSWSARKKKESIFCTIYFVRRELFWDLCFISMYSVFNTLSEYTYFYISKNITSYTFVACF